MGFLSHQGNGSLIVLCNGVVSCSVERQDFLPADGKSLFFVKIFIFHFSLARGRWNFYPAWREIQSKRRKMFGVSTTYDLSSIDRLKV